MGVFSNPRAQLVLAAALFSTGGAAIKLCGLEGLAIGGLRSLIAVAALLVFAPQARRWPSKRAWLVAVVYAATLLCFVVANKLTSSANTIFLQSTAPLYLLLLSPWLLREKLRGSDLVFMLLIGLGLSCFFLADSVQTSSAPRPAAGNLVALASGLCWAFTVLGLRWLGTRPGESALSAVVAGNALAFAASIAFLPAPTAIAAGDWAVLVFLGVFQIAAAYLLVSRALQKVPAFEASILLLIEPALNPIWAFLVHSEIPGALELCGGALVLLATTAQVCWKVRSARLAGAQAS